jgi:hypothetical protein
MVEPVLLTEYPSPMVSLLLYSGGAILISACVDWEMTIDMLDNLNQASLTRRDLIAKREGSNPAVEQLKSE